MISGELIGVLCHVFNYNNFFKYKLVDFYFRDALISKRFFSTW